MTRWKDVALEAPDLTAVVRAVFAAGTGKTLATLRTDGSPRISALGCAFGEDVTLGLVPGSATLRDVTRDPRVALHSPTLEPPSDARQWVGDAEIAGVLRESPRPEDGPPGGYFWLDVQEVVLTCLDAHGAGVVVTSWRAGRGVTRVAGG